MLYQKYHDKFPLIVDALIRAKRNGRFAHSYLLHSDQRIIREEFSCLIAMIATCKHTIELNRPCETCPSCIQLRQDSYSELYELYPIGKSRQIQVGDPKNPEPNSVRYFEERFYRTSTAIGGCKIGIIHDADRLNKEAQNALLKTLEEPPQNTLFILCSGNPEMLLPTTRSRCQLLSLITNRCNFDYPAAHDVFATLHKLLQNSQNPLVQAVQSHRILMNTAEALEAAAAERITAEFNQNRGDSSNLEPSAIKRLDKQLESLIAGEYLKDRVLFLDSIYCFFAQLYQLESGAKPESLANPEMFEDLKLQLPVSGKKLEHAVSEAGQLLFNLKFNVNLELALESFCLNIALKA